MKSPPPASPHTVHCIKYLFFLACPKDPFLIRSVLPILYHSTHPIPCSSTYQASAKSRGMGLFLHIRPPPPPWKQPAKMPISVSYGPFLLPSCRGPPPLLFQAGPAQVEEGGREGGGQIMRARTRERREETLLGWVGLGGGGMG